MKTALLILATLAGLTGCQLTVSPDGSRQWAISGQEAARAIIILSEK